MPNILWFLTFQAFLMTNLMVKSWSRIFKQVENRTVPTSSQRSVHISTVYWSLIPTNLYETYSSFVWVSLKNIMLIQYQKFLVKFFIVVTVDVVFFHVVGRRRVLVRQLHKSWSHKYICKNVEQFPTHVWRNFTPVQTRINLNRSE